MLRGRCFPNICEDNFYYIKRIQYANISNKDEIHNRCKDPVRCTLLIDNKPIAQLMSFNYMEWKFIRTKEDRNQINKANRISRSRADIIWNNEYVNTKAKQNIPDMYSTYNDLGNRDKSR